MEGVGCESEDISERGHGPGPAQLANRSRSRGSWVGAFGRTADVWSGPGSRVRDPEPAGSAGGFVTFGRFRVGRRARKAEIGGLLTCHLVGSLVSVYHFDPVALLINLPFRRPSMPRSGLAVEKDSF